MLEVNVEQKEEKQVGEEQERQMDSSIASSSSSSSCFELHYDDKERKLSRLGYQGKVEVVVKDLQAFKDLAAAGPNDQHEGKEKAATSTKEDDVSAAAQIFLLFNGVHQCCGVTETFEHAYMPAELLEQIRNEKKMIIPLLLSR